MPGEDLYNLNDRYPANVRLQNVRLVHSRGHAVRVVGSLAIVRGSLHGPLTTVPVPLTRSPDRDRSGAQPRRGGQCSKPRLG